jgi:hypothetical protein
VAANSFGISNPDHSVHERFFGGVERGREGERKLVGTVMK